MCDALTFLLDNIFIRFGPKLYRQVVGILMGTNCAPLVADLFLFCFERDFMMVYKLIKIVGSNIFSAQFIKIIPNYKKIGYNINVLQQTACLVVNPITVGNFAFLSNCTPVGQTSDSKTALT